jgi:long-chain acyl-CoA synthetase
MSIGTHARRAPDHPALIISSSGYILTYRELDERSNRLARLLQAQGVRRGDTVAMFMENNPRFMEVVWAARRSGLYLTAVNRYLTADEAAYIIDDSDAAVLISSYARTEVAAALPSRLRQCRAFLMIDGVVPGWSAYESAVADVSSDPLDQEWLGELRL